MDPNHILLFIAVISPSLILARAWRPGGAVNRGWLKAALVVLGITGIAWLFIRNYSGYVGGGAWFALLFLPVVGRRKADDLAMRHRYKSAAQLATLLKFLHPTAEFQEQARVLRMLESRALAGVGPPPLPISPASQNRLVSAPVVLAIIILNVLAFVFEFSRGNLDDPQVLHQLGALAWYDVVIDHEYWRLLTALFIHAGAIHLGFNLFALYVLGPGLERTIGAVRFAVCYLFSGLGSTIGVVALTSIGLVRPSELVGASGCIMGIVGAWAGFLLRHQQIPRARERLLNIGMIVVIQFFFDLSTPQVSMSAHLCGLLTGFLVGLIISPRERAG